MLPQAVCGGRVFAALDLCVESCSRICVGHRDRQPGERVNKPSYVQLSIIRDDARGFRRIAINEGNGDDWRFGNIRFSVNCYGYSDDRQLRDHHRRGQYGYGCSRAAPHFHHFQNGSTVLKCAKSQAVLRRAGRASQARPSDQIVRLLGDQRLRSEN